MVRFCPLKCACGRVDNLARSLNGPKRGDEIFGCELNGNGAGGVDLSARNTYSRVQGLLAKAHVGREGTAGEALSPPYFAASTSASASASSSAGSARSQIAALVVLYRGE